MKNKYEIRGDVTAIFIKSPKYGLIETLIDTVDLPKAAELEGSWSVCWKPDVKSFYVIGNIKTEQRRTTTQLHRWITNPAVEMKVDHINHDTLDNRRSCNLRVVTNAQNMQNRKGTSSNNTSGYRGVTWDKRYRKWVAQLMVDGKYKHIGSFKDREKARVVVEEARKKLMPYSQ